MAYVSPVRLQLERNASKFWATLAVRIVGMRQLTAAEADAAIRPILVQHNLTPVGRPAVSYETAIETDPTELYRNPTTGVVVENPWRPEITVQVTLAKWNVRQPVVMTREATLPITTAIRQQAQQALPGFRVNVTGFAPYKASSVIERVKPKTPTPTGLNLPWWPGPMLAIGIALYWARTEGKF